MPTASSMPPALTPLQRSAAYQAVRRGTAPAPLRWTVAATQSLSAALAAWLGTRLFFTAPRAPVPPAAAAILAQGRSFSFRSAGRTVAGWRWGRDGDPVVYLVHGWGGHAGRMTAFVAPLVEAGYAVVTFDAPGHGASGGGMSSMPEFSRALVAVAGVYGAPHAVIAHSLGAAASALAVQWGLAPTRLVLLAPPLDPGRFMPPFAAALGLTPQVVQRLQRASEIRLGFSWDQLDVRRMVPAQPMSLLVVHDSQDQTVLPAEGAAIAEAWDGRLLCTSGLGHSGLLRDPAVVLEVAKFVAAPQPELAAAPAGASSAARLEWELFHREARR